jgi:hypothetical protein
MTIDEIQRAVALLDTTSSLDEEAAWSQLRPLGPDVVPFLRDFFPRCRSWQGRASLVFHSVRFARTSGDAFDLGVGALQDRSTVVRYRACGLVAYSLRHDALGPLKSLLGHRDPRTVADATAAIAAIEYQNHHLFVDRDGSGRTRWVVNEGDDD